MVGIKHPSREVQQDNANRRAGQYVHLVPETSICDGFWPEDPRNFHKTIEAFRFVLNVLRFWQCAICICHHGRAESAWTWAPVDLQGPELTECRRSLTESVTLIHVWSCSYCAFRRQNLPGSEIHAREQRRRSELQSRKFDFVSNELYIYMCKRNQQDPPFCNPSQNCISRLHYVHPDSVCSKDVVLELMFLIFFLDPLGTTSTAWYELGTARNHFWTHPSYKPKRWVYSTGYPGGWKTHVIPWGR